MSPLTRNQAEYSKFLEFESCYDECYNDHNGPTDYGVSVVFLDTE